MTKFTRIWVLLASFSLAACQGGIMRTLKAPYAFSPYQKTTLSYGSHSAQKLDVYVPTDKKFADQTLPTIVFYFGGSWRNGKRAWYEFFAAHYCLKGYVVVVPDYRKAPEFVFPIFMHDAASAFAYARVHARQWHSSPERVFVMGHSAGAHMAALLSLDPQYLAAENLKPADIAGFVGISGPYDFLPLTDPLVVEVFNGDAQSKASQPINYVEHSAEAPPMLLVHGGKDSLVWPKNSINLAHEVNQRGGSAKVLIVPKAGHIKTLLQAARGLRWLASDIDGAVLAFLREHSQPIDPDGAARSR